MNERYEAMAIAVMSSPDPTRALASLIGDHEARLDIAMERLAHVESRLTSIEAQR